MWLRTRLALISLVVLGVPSTAAALARRVRCDCERSRVQGQQRARPFRRSPLAQARQSAHVLEHTLVP